MSPRLRISSALNRNRRTNPSEPPEVRLEAPHGDEHARIDAVTLADVNEQRPVLREHRLRGSRERWREAALQVLIERQREFGLGPVALEDRVIRMVDIGECAVENLGADTLRERLGAELSEPLRE
jgi:hypothetical protein